MKRLKKYLMNKLFNEISRGWSYTEWKDPLVPTRGPVGELEAVWDGEHPQHVYVYRSKN